MRRSNFFPLRYDYASHFNVCICAVFIKIYSLYLTLNISDSSFIKSCRLGMILNKALAQILQLRAKFDVIMSRKFRSSRSQMFFKIGVVKYSASFTGKHLCCSFFLIKKLFTCEICKIFTNTLLQNTSGGCFCKLQ